ncbi:MAG: phosphoglycerate dehydrogenase [Terriglobales bacterium]
MKIVVAEKIAASAVELLKQQTGWTVLTPEQITDLAEEVRDADALIVRSAVDVNEGLLAQTQKLRVIGRAGVGVDNVDLDAATRKGIAVMNTPGANAVAVAEQTIGMMIAMARHLCRADRLMHQGKWEKKSLQGTELRGKTLGIVGLGRIGMEVARRALPFGMTLIAHDPYISPAVAEEAGVKLTSLDELFASSDYITLHLGLTPQTAGMINAETLKKMKKGVRIVNCARGELIDEAALAEALKSGHVAAAALDVFQSEPVKDTPLAAMENVTLTPHIGGSTKEAQDAVGVQIAQQVKEYLTTGVFQNAVNVPSVSYEEYLEMQPYIVLAERLGAFVAQITEGNLQEVGLRYSGRIASWKTDLVRNAAVMGVLNQSLAEYANVVNATSVAEARGIRISEMGKTRREGGGASDVLTITLRTSAGEQVVRGTVLHHNSPRLLAVGNIDVEARLEQNLIYIRNADVPGVVGQVGTILARHGVNIANFSLGRAENGKQPAEAVGVVRVDGSIPEDVLHEIRKIEAVRETKAILFTVPSAEKSAAAEAE